ncbi:aminoglycoside phosphotransferase family protein [Roseivivax marinus]|uniref:aminoglycoside phosphotransferase family protein n=1 Tax=Roseivivax marinus TaxID=1379903 RepID=UPI00273D1BF4|nr:phosphotransferase [Roseivivax marinus]
MDTLEPFLSRAGWADARRTALAGDASARRYTRLMREDGARAILMVEPGGSVARFDAVGAALRGMGLSAPEVWAVDTDAGLMLLEDLGDAVFAPLAEADPALEVTLYETAADVLSTLHRHGPLPELEQATPERLADMTDLAFDWYLVRAGATPDPAAKASARAAFATVLAAHAPETGVTILRDYHAENLIWLPDREGAARAGLLDFQDAMAGHPAYDLVSLLQDARRDVGAAAADAAMTRFLDGSDHDPDRFAAAYAALGAQRNLRILGVFARLAATRAKPHYIDLIPRVWAHLQTNLAHPACAPLRAPLAVLPDPTTALLSRLKAPCLTQ